VFPESEPRADNRLTVAKSDDESLLWQPNSYATLGSETVSADAY
jgi:hypothetical protein